MQKILDWPVPLNPAEIRAFNGLINYIAEFISALAEPSTVLSRLTRKGVEFEWTPIEQNVGTESSRRFLSFISRRFCDTHM